MAACNDTNASNANSREESKLHTKKPTYELLVLEKQDEPLSSLLKVKNHEEPPSALLKRKPAASFDSNESFGRIGSFSDSLSVETKFSNKKSENDPSFCYKDFSLLSQEFNKKSFDLTAHSDSSTGEDFTHSLGKTNFLTNFFQFDEFYERAENFLDFQNIKIVIPGDEHKTKKFIKVLSKHHSLETKQADVTESPTLSKVCSSSLLIRRQNSPLLTYKPKESSSPFALNLQKSVSLPLNSSPLNSYLLDEIFKEKTSKAQEKGVVEEESKYIAEDCQLEIKEPKKAIKVSTGFKNPLQKLQTNKMNFLIGKIIEENSPVTPSNCYE